MIKFISKNIYAIGFILVATVLLTAVLVLATNATATGNNNEWRAQRTTADWEHIDAIKAEFEKLQRGDILIRKNGEYLLVAEVSSRFVKVRSSNERIGYESSEINDYLAFELNRQS